VSARTVFDADYYRRFYRDRPVHDRRRVARLAEGVFGMCGWWGVPVRSVLDIGAGPGYWRDWLASSRPRVRYHSVDVSAYAAARYGHEQQDISVWAPTRPFDVVVCQGVLQYLDDVAAGRAIANLARATRSILYLEVPSTEDRDTVLDTERTDFDIWWRSAKWYRARMTRNFVELGCGLHCIRSAGVYFYELERSR
jgi:trans-aconitate methyltransferase